MTVAVRIERKPASWRITVTPDQANVIAFEAASICVNVASGKFKLGAIGTDGSHLDIMADIILGPAKLSEYCTIFMEGSE